MTADEVRRLISEDVRRSLETQWERRGYLVMKPDESAARRVRVEIGEIRQRNRDRREIMNDPNGGQSRTNVKFRWETIGEGFRRLEGESRGPFFGSTDRAVLKGAPEDEVRAILAVHRQRAQSIGNAVFQGIENEFPAR